MTAIVQKAVILGPSACVVAQRLFADEIAAEQMEVRMFKFSVCVVGMAAFAGLASPAASQSTNGNVKPKPVGEQIKLNPQPIPPKDPVMLNPQPIPPKDPVMLNPQPIPPKEPWDPKKQVAVPGDKVKLNPQPIPPKTPIKTQAQ